MKSVYFVVAVLVIFLVAFLGFSDVVITYVGGSCKVDRDGKGKFADAGIDMELGAAAVVKTGPDGGVELSIDGDTVSIGPGSVVKVSDLLGSVSERKKNGWLASVSKYTKNVGRRGGTQASTTLAGVRGERAVSEDMEWFEDDQKESEYFSALGEGKELFDEGRYAQAIPVFEDLLTGESPDDTRAGSGRAGTGQDSPVLKEASFYLGVCLFNVLRYREALPHLEESISDMSADYAEPALFHHALTLFMLERYGAAFEDFKRYRKEFPGLSLEPYAILMLGKSCKKMGKTQEARSYFQELQREYGDTEVSAYAREELKEL
jgi:hypothetical protein